MEHICMTASLDLRCAKKASSGEPRLSKMVIDRVVERSQQSKTCLFELPRKQSLVPGAKAPRPQFHIVRGYSSNDRPDEGHIGADELVRVCRIHRVGRAEPGPVCRSHPRSHEMLSDSDPAHHPFCTLFQEGSRQRVYPVRWNTHIVIGEGNNLTGGLGEDTISRIAKADRILSDGPDSERRMRVGAQRVPGPVTRAVVDDQKLSRELKVDMAKRVESAEKACAIVSGADGDAKPHVEAVRRSCTGIDSLGHPSRIWSRRLP